MFHKLVLVFWWLVMKPTAMRGAFELALGAAVALSDGPLEVRQRFARKAMALHDSKKMRSCRAICARFERAHGAGAEYRRGWLKTKAVIRDVAAVVAAQEVCS